MLIYILPAFISKFITEAGNFSVGRCASKRQPKGKASKSMGEKSYYYHLCNHYEVEPWKEIRQNTKEQPTLGDELTPSKTQFSGFAMQSIILSLLNL